jgi:beta-lactamase superfamily II metal-dependent hydrolase
VFNTKKETKEEYYVNDLELEVYRDNKFNEKIINLIFGDVVYTDNIVHKAPIIKNKELEYKNITVNINGRKKEGVIRHKKIIYKIYEKANHGYTLKEEDNLIQKPMLEIYFIDVGQGDSILIMTPDKKKKKILIDGGPDDSCHKFLKKKYLQRKFLIKFNQLHLDAIIMIHADSDHVKGLINILKDNNIIIRNIIHNGIAKFATNEKNKYTLGNREGEGKEMILTSLYDDDLSYFNDTDKKPSDNFTDLINGIKIAIGNASKKGHKTVLKRIDNKIGTTIFSNLISNSHELSIDVLGPIDVGSSTKPAYKYFRGDNKSGSKSINGNSIVLLIKYKDCRIFLGGDINEEFENYFLATTNLDNNDKDSKSIQTHIFKANHHGSDKFNPTFLEKISPSISIVSSGHYQNFGHPRAILLGSLGKLQNLNTPSLLFCTQLIGRYKKVGILHRLFHPNEKEEEYVENNKDGTKTDKGIKTGISSTLKFFKELPKRIKDLLSNPQIVNNIYPVYIKNDVNSVVIRSDGNRIFAGRIYNINEKDEDTIINKDVQWEKHLFTIKGKELELIEENVKINV